MQVPCGYCLLCREEQARQTAVRIYHEAQSYADNSFVTLSYNDQHLPKYGSLDYRDLVKFTKRLNARIKRRAKKDPLTPPRMRYYAVGEYGTRSHRAHYHLCIFGHAFLEGRIILATTPHTLWTSPELIDCWGLGHVAVGDLNFATARYTAQYICKKLRAKQKYVRVDEETGELIALEQPRAFMSKNLGKEWWGKYYRQTVDHDHVIIGGQPQKPPKAYDRWLGEAEPETVEKIKEERKRKAIANSKTSAETRARARNAHARAKTKKESL